MEKQGKSLGAWLFAGCAGGIIGGLIGLVLLGPLGGTFGAVLLGRYMAGDLRRDTPTHPTHPALPGPDQR